MFKLRKSACTTCAGSSENFPMADPFFGSTRWGPKWGPELDQIFIPSFRSLLGPRFGIQIWTQKWGQPSENFAAARRGFARLKAEEKSAALTPTLAWSHPSSVSMALIAFERIAADALGLIVG